MSLYCKLVPVQYREYDINLFLMIFSCMSLHCMLVPVQYRTYDQGRIQKIQKEGAEFSAAPPPYENFTFQDMQVTALWCICDAK